MDGAATPAQAGALLLLQRFRGEAPDELLGYVDAARARMRPFRPQVDGLLDVGSPYDGRGKHVVVSPAASLVAAAAGVPIVMHGEPDMGPKRGVAIGDVIAAMGVDTDLEPDVVAGGIEFCWPGLRAAGAARAGSPRAEASPGGIGVANAAPHDREDLRSGAGAVSHRWRRDMPYLKILGPVLAGLGYRKTMVVQGMEGHEDVPTSRGARIVEIDERGEHESRIDAAAIGLEPTDDDLAPGDAGRSARFTLAVLEGSASASQRDLVLLNASLRLLAAERADDLPAALDQVRAALASGEALRRLEAWRGVG